MFRVAPEVILRPNARRDVMESEGAQGTYCRNCRFAYLVLFTYFGQSSMLIIECWMQGMDVLSQYIPSTSLSVDAEEYH